MHKPRIDNNFGMKIYPHYSSTKKTWIEGEEMCNDYGQFRRRAIAVHDKTKELIECKGDIPDTFFTIPATTNSEHGFITKDNDNDQEFTFHPHNEQVISPVKWRKQYKKDCK